MDQSVSVLFTEVGLFVMISWFSPALSLWTIFLSAQYLEVSCNPSSLAWLPFPGEIQCYFYAWRVHCVLYLPVFFFFFLVRKLQRSTKNNISLKPIFKGKFKAHLSLKTAALLNSMASLPVYTFLLLLQHTVLSWVFKSLQTMYHLKVSSFHSVGVLRSNHL